jgi:CubicO group peptidase (beta-lactamase class C family)
MDSTYSRDLPRPSNRAAGYEKKEGQLVPRDSDLTDVFAAGAMVSTAVDLTKWVAAIESDRLLKRSTLDQMWTPLQLNDGSSYPYGFGWRLDDYKGRKNIGHSGSTSGFSASLQRFPQKKLTVIVLCNLGEQATATTMARAIALNELTVRRAVLSAGANHVAQISNLHGLHVPHRSTWRAACGMQCRDTADCKSALLTRDFASPLSSSIRRP